MRVKYVHADKYVSRLPVSLGSYFVPPVVTNLLFIDSDFQSIYNFKTFNIDGLRLKFMRDSLKGEPITVGDKDMEMFKRICSAMEAPIVMTERPTVKLGSHVRVKEGPFKGLEGYVVRMKKSKRILVNISNVVWAATEFVSPDLLEVIEEPAAE